MTADSRPSIALPSPPRRRPKPALTYLLVVANVVVFLMQSYRWGVEASIIRFGQDQIAVWDGEIWRLITAPFLHGFWVHLFMNCLGLLLLGDVVEARFGRWKLAVAYSLSGLAGGLVFQAFPATVGVGASGAVYGLAGALLVIRFGRVVDGRFLLGRAFFVVGALLPAVDWVFAQVLAYTSGLQVATTAHLGGFVCGAVLGYLFQHPQSFIPRGRRRALGVLGSTSLIILFVYGCFYPFLNPAWPVWRRIHAGVEQGNVEPKDLVDLARLSHSPEVVQRVIRTLLERGKATDAEGRAAEKKGAAGEAQAHYLAAEARYKQAIRIWENLGTENWSLKRFAGYQLYDELMAVGMDGLATRILDSLVDGTRRSLKSGIDPWEKRAHFLNDLAWFLAMQGENLGEALFSAKAAVDLVRSHAPGALWRFFGSDHTMESICLNTLGWVQFLIAATREESRQIFELFPEMERVTTEQAMKNLHEAAELASLGPNFLYLGMAHARLGNERQAIEALRGAEDIGGLSPHERRLLREVKDELGM